MKQVARIALVVLVAACSTYDVQGLALVTPLNSIVVGDTVSLSVVTLEGTVRAADGVSWQSSDETIATIDGAGIVLGTGPGTAILRASTEGYDLRVALLVLETAGPFLALGAGADHNCGLAENGTAWCWGRNEYGQLGSALAPDRCPLPGGGDLFCAAAAIPVPGVSLTDLVAGTYHNCGLDEAGIAHCWGANDVGQLGDGGTASGPAPLPVVGEHRFSSLAAGQRRTCGIRLDDALLCWGIGPFRVDGVVYDTLPTPERVAAEHRFARVATSSGHTCGITTSGATYCWGLNDRGQLGVETVDSTCGATPCALDPQAVASATAFVDLAVGRDFSCGLAADGVVHCWGGNDAGQLGDGAGTDRFEPQPIAGGHTFSRLATGSTHACGVDDAGRLLCWGSPVVGIGSGEDPVPLSQPTAGAPGLTFPVLGIGFDTQCGVEENGITWCWGGNLDGAVGNGRPQFTTVLSPERVVRHPDYSSRVIGPG